MVRVPPHRSPHALSVAALCGLGLALFPFRIFINHFNIPAPLPTLLTLKLFLPLSCILIAIWYPRRLLILLISPLVYLAYIAGSLLQDDWQFWTWSTPLILGRFNPPLIVSALTSTLLAFSAATIAQRWRIVAPPRVESPCPRCGYSRAALITQPCPECGTLEPITPPRSLDS